MGRFNAPTPGVPSTEVLELGFDEIVLVPNDPDHLERGFIRFDVTADGNEARCLRSADHRPLLFPRRPDNRPGLPRIGYRIGRIPISSRR